MANNEEPLLGAMSDDPALARQLRKSVQLLADNCPNPQLQAMLRETLGGTRGFRDVVTSSDFVDVFRDSSQAAVDQAAGLSDAEKDELSAQARVRIDEEYAHAGESVRGTQDDDDYFENRGSILNHGW